MHFASDNTAPVHPKIMEALQKANAGYPSSYGTDPLMDEVRENVREIFEAPEAAVFLVPTGTAANALALSTLIRPFDTVYCHELAHIAVDECAAPEFYAGGAKLSLIGGDHAKLTPDTLRSTIKATDHGSVHSVQRGAVSITNATEMGVNYSAAEVAALNAVCEEFNLPLHMDGARFTNALIAEGCTPAEMTWKAGVDILSFGGTKNGLMGVEAVIIFNPDLAWEFELRRKRGGHLFSKHRYLSAQMVEYLKDDLWLELARKANAAARKLSAGVLGTDGCSLLAPSEINAVFVRMPRSKHKRAIDAGAEYFIWPHEQTLDGPDDEPVSARLMCSWSTTDAEIDLFLNIIAD